MSICHPEGASTRRCAWGVVIESMPEGLQASSALKAIKFKTPRHSQSALEGGAAESASAAERRGAQIASQPVLSLVVYTLSCSASANEPDTLFKDEV